MKTAIEWCDYTFNPWRGCAKVSPGCASCYAETLSRRNPNVLGTWGPTGQRVIAAESYWRLPLRWNEEAKESGERRKVFCASLSDVFEDRPELVDSRYRLFDLVCETPSLDWLLLTKRPDQAKYWLDDEWEESPTNVWIGVSVEDQQRANDLVPLLLQTPAAVRFLSCEPLLDRVFLPFGWAGSWSSRCSAGCGLKFADCKFEPDALCRCAAPLRITKNHDQAIHWVIIGGESGPNARPCHIEWIRSLVEQCRAAGVACLVKQLGRKPIGINGVPLQLHDREGRDPSEWPEDLRVRQFPGGSLC